MQDCDLNIVNQQGFNVQTSDPVALYVLQDPGDNYNAAQFLVLPVNFLSSQYAGGSGSFGNKYTGIVVAMKDGTILTTGTNRVTLNRMDVYYTSAATPTTANFPFAYIYSYSNSSTSSPSSSVFALPITTARKRNAIASYTSGISSYQMYALNSNTQVSVNGASNITVNLNQPCETSFAGGGVFVSNNPMLVFSFSLYPDYAYTMDMFLSMNVHFYTAGVVKSKYAPVVMIITPLGSTGNILLDGHVIPALQYRRVPYSHDYYYTQTL